MIAEFRLTNRAGPGAVRPCGGEGDKADVAFLIKGGKIPEWRRAGGLPGRERARASAAPRSGRPGRLDSSAMSATAADVYAIPQEHLDFRDTIRQIAQERVAPRAAEIDATDEYPWDLRKLLRRAGHPRPARSRRSTAAPAPAR